jgi:ABC-type glutathione transport system ATPase component
MVMKEGCVVESGTADEVFLRPQAPYTRRAARRRNACLTCPLTDASAVQPKPKLSYSETGDFFSGAS